MNVIIPLIGTSALAAAAYFTYDALMKYRLLENQYSQLQDAAAQIPGASKNPATIIVLGFENHGRSSFVNSVFRVLYREEGPLIMRAESGPAKRTTTSPKLFSVKNKLFRYPKYLLKIIDTPTFSASAHLDHDFLRRILREWNESSPKVRNIPAPECVVLIIRSDDVDAQGPAYKKLPELVKVVAEEGLQFMVVLSHRNKMKKVWANKLQNLTTDVAMRTGTDFVQCIENYIAHHQANGRNGASVKNDFYTHIQILSIVQQCFEYVKQRRQTMNKSIDNMHKSKSLKMLDELDSPNQSFSDGE